MVERELANAVGPLEPKFDGAQDHDFMLRAAEILDPSQIDHVPEVLYHWRKTANSTASSMSAKPHAPQAGIAAITAHLKRRGLRADVVAIGSHALYRTRWRFEQPPQVSIIMPFR